jgi:hypothetical protein
LPQSITLETTDVARPSYRRTDRYPDPVWRNFRSLELSPSKGIVTSLSPGKGEKMSRYNLRGGDPAGLPALFAELKRKAKKRTESDYPIITIHEAGLDGSGSIALCSRKQAESWCGCLVRRPNVSLIWQTNPDR